MTGKFAFAFLNVARHGWRGWRLDKAERSDKIDGVVALAMALDRAEHRPEPVRVIRKYVKGRKDDRTIRPGRT